MPNKSSNVGHKPIRTCSICKKRNYQKDLIHYKLIKKEVVFDVKRKLPGRGYYVCNDNICIKKLRKRKS